MIEPISQVRLFVPDEILITNVLLFDGIQKAYAAIHEHNIIKVEIDGHRTMTRDEFIAYCVEHGLDK
ncbi:hypothetical protein [Phyllobacterium zundukense]|uniref:Uncharacterized protein n=1 Tax=Phyllobacterium zundukense TaxID=1867719 RepID=A0ACD4CXC9_9HYPH|nr:hypothetical protein [Phyllobacterium zundukense]UXN58267.1 hypothetical protein N8E88_05525 [Phyllobacterium zundukense]